jgi:hypothetical protein
MFINIVARLILIFGGLFYLVQASGLKINYESFVYRMLAFMIGLCALYFAFDRDYYLPFLGQSVIPSLGGKVPLTTTSLGGKVPLTTDKEEVPDNLKKVRLTNVPPNTRIIYWAAKSTYPATGELDWRVYNDYSNSGVAQSDSFGNTFIKLECPVEYDVPRFFGLGKRRLRRHLHYRYEIPGQTGLFSRVYTKYIEC